MPQSALCSLPSALAAGVCAASLLSGCDVTIKDGDITNVSMRHKVSEEWSRHYPLAEGGRVEIVNSNGPIEVAAGPAGAVDITAALDAGAMTEASAKEILREITIEETAKPDHVRVATVRRSGRGGLEVSFKVTMPPGARLEMTGNNGRLRADGLSGHVKAMVVNGGVELTAMRGTIDAAGVNASVSAKMAEVTGPLRLESTNGRIALEIPRTARATLNARSVNGNITATGLTIAEGTGRRIRTLESQVNGGGPEIDLRVTNGRISITGVESPQVQSPQVQSPQPR
jgi:Putative adhesin